jgi:hypothetical protein
MYFGTRPTNEPTDIHDIADLILAWQVLKDNWYTTFDTSKNRVMYSIRSYLDNYAKRIGRWDYTDLVHNSLVPEDFVTYSYITSTELKDNDPGSVLWTLQCCVGWVLNDAAVTYTFESTKDSAAIACDLWRLKIDWVEATQMDLARRQKDKLQNEIDYLSTLIES